MTDDDYRVIVCKEEFTYNKRWPVCQHWRTKEEQEDYEKERGIVRKSKGKGNKK